MECLVCKNTKCSKFMAAKRYHPNYWRCNECGFVFAHPQLEFNYENFRFVPASAPELSTRLANYEVRYRAMEKFITRKDINLLDIGANCGIFLKYAQTKGMEALGIDPNLLAAQYGRTMYNVEIQPGVFEEYEFNGDARFDLITMFNVLEHVADPVATITKVRSILHDDGLLVLELPNIFHALCLLSSGKWHHFQRSHNWFFDQTTITQWLSGMGFVVRKFMYIPKVVTLSACFDILLSSLKIYSHVSRKTYLKIRQKSLYKYLSGKTVELNMHDYFLVICGVSTGSRPAMLLN